MTRVNEFLAMSIEELQVLQVQHNDTVRGIQADLPKIQIAINLKRMQAAEAKLEG